MRGRKVQELDSEGWKPVCPLPLGFQGVISHYRAAEPGENVKIFLGSWSDQAIRGFGDTRPQTRCVAEGGPEPLILMILLPQPPKCRDDRATPRLSLWEMFCCYYY